MSIRFRGDRSTALIRLVVALLLLAGIVLFIDPDTVFTTAAGANGIWIVAAVSLLPINLFLEAAKWRLLLMPSGVECSLRDSLGSILAGYALGFITPGRFGDYAGRVLFFSDAGKGSLLVMAGLDRLYSIWVYAAAGTVVLGFQLGGSLPGPGGVWWLTFVLGALLTVLLGLVVARPATLYGISSALLRWRSTKQWRRHFDAAREVGRMTGLVALFVSLARYAIFCTQFVFLLLAFSTSSSILSLYPGVALVFFVKTIVPSISLFDLGIRESAAIFFLAFFGVTAGAAFTASLLLFAINLALPALAGIAFVPRIRWMRFGRTAQESPVVGVRTG